LWRNSGYSYSGGKHPANIIACPSSVMALLQFFRQLGFPLNMFFGNMYRSRRSGIGAHADDEEQFMRGGNNDLSRSVIGVVFGSDRRAIRFSPHGKSTKYVDVIVPHGWCYVMHGEFQEKFFHSIVQAAPKFLEKIKDILRREPSPCLERLLERAKGPDRWRELKSDSIDFCDWIADAVGHSLKRDERKDQLRAIFRTAFTAAEYEKLADFFSWRLSLTGRCFAN
jgi:alkylated DNA repair dioxygenase AlkB